MASQVWPAKFGQPNMARQIWPAEYDRHRSPTCILNCSSYGGQFLIIIDSREPKDLSGTDLKFVTHFGCNKMAGQLWTSFTFRQIWPAKYGQPNMASQVWPANDGQILLSAKEALPGRARPLRDQTSLSMRFLDLFDFHKSHRTWLPCR